MIATNFFSKIKMSREQLSHLKLAFEGNKEASFSDYDKRFVLTLNQFGQAELSLFIDLEEDEDASK